MASEADVYAGLTEIFHEVFGNDSLVLTPTTSAENVAGWDSIKMVTIIIGVEQHFGIKLRSREVDQLKNVGDLATLVKTKAG